MRRVAAGPRLAAFVLDLLFVIVLTAVLGQWEVDILPNLTSIDTSAGAAAVVIFVLWLTTILYLVIELAAGASPGKAILGLRIARCDGQKASFGRRFIRFVGKALIFMFVPPFGLTESDYLIWPLLVLSAVSILGAFFIFGPERQALYDILAGTAVFRKNKARK